MATIRPMPKSPKRLEVRFVCCVTGKKKSIAVGSGDMAAAESLKVRIQDLILEVRNGKREKPSQRIIDSGRLLDWYRLNGVVELPELDLRKEWLADIEGSVSLRTLDGYRQHIGAFSLSDPKQTLRNVQERFTPGTAKKYAATFGTYWNWLTANGHVDKLNPLSGFRFAKSDEKEERWSYRDLSEHLKTVEDLTVDDPRWNRVMRQRVYLADSELSEAKDWARSFLSGTFNDRKFALCCLLSSEAGMRRGEIVRVRKQDLNGQILFIRRTKGSLDNRYKTTRSAVTEATAYELRRLFDDTDSEYPFSRRVMPDETTTDFEKAVIVEANHLGNLLKTRKGRFPFPGALFGYHLFRHSLNARAKQRLSKEQTMEMLGHTTDTMYHSYGGSDSQELIDAVNVIA